MARKLSLVAALLALTSMFGCDFSIEDDGLGVGGSCRQNRECVSGLECVNRVCVPVPPVGKPETLDASINADLQVPTLKPKPLPDAGPGDGG